MKLSSKRILLRPVRESDAKDIHKNINDFDMSEIAMSTLWASAQSNQAISEHAQKLRNTLRTLVRSF